MTTLGLNLPANPRYSVAEIVATGAQWVRLTYREQYDLTSFFQGLWFNNIGIILVGDSRPDSLTDDQEQWQIKMIQMDARYGDWVKAYQFGNEFDADEGEESSWRMAPGRLNTLNFLARNALPHRTRWLAAACSGQPSRLDGVDLTLVSAVTCHPYAKSPNTPELEAMLSGYLAWGKPVAITEYDSRTPGMSTFLAADPRLLTACVFALHDDVAGFGLIDQQGTRRLSYYEFVQVAHSGVPDTGGITMAEYKFGIQTKAQELEAAGVAVGAPLEDETYITPDYSLQTAEGGLFVYSKKANKVTFLAAR